MLASRRGRLETRNAGALQEWRKVAELVLYELQQGAVPEVRGCICVDELSLEVTYASRPWSHTFVYRGPRRIWENAKLLLPENHGVLAERFRNGMRVYLVARLVCVKRNAMRSVDVCYLLHWIEAVRALL